MLDKLVLYGRGLVDLADPGNLAQWKLALVVEILHALVGGEG